MKTPFALLVFCLLLGSLHAQKNFSFGFEGQYGISSISPAKDYTPKASFSAGIRVEYNLSENFTLQSGLFYTNRGFKKEISGLTWGTQHDLDGGFDPSLPGEFDKANLHYNFNYIHVPIAVMLHLRQTDKSKMYIKGGLGALVHFSSYISSVYDGNTSSKAKQVDPTKRYITPNLNVQFAYGWRKPFNNQRASFYLEPKVELMPFGFRKDAVESNVLYAFGLAVGIML